MVSVIDPAKPSNSMVTAPEMIGTSEQRPRARHGAPDPKTWRGGKPSETESACGELRDTDSASAALGTTSGAVHTAYLLR